MDEPVVSEICRRVCHATRPTGRFAGRGRFRPIVVRRISRSFWPSGSRISNMGRKVHPVGFRLKVIRDWNARWYAEGGLYRDLLQEDMAIRRMIKQDLNGAGVAKVEIERFPNQVR
jgi:hypothetical protein